MCKCSTDRTLNLLVQNKRPYFSQSSSRRWSRIRFARLRRALFLHDVSTTDPPSSHFDMRFNAGSTISKLTLRTGPCRFIEYSKVAQ